MGKPGEGQWKRRVVLGGIGGSRSGLRDEISEHLGRCWEGKTGRWGVRGRGRRCWNWSYGRGRKELVGKGGLGHRFGWRAINCRVVWAIVEHTWVCVGTKRVRVRLEGRTGYGLEDIDYEGLIHLISLNCLSPNSFHSYEAFYYFLLCL